MELYFPEAPIPLDDLNRLTVDENLLRALIRQESGFNSQARSKAGAIGLMQIMPGTAKTLGGMSLQGQLLRPDLNLKIGSRYFLSLLEKYKGDTELALAAYNAGPKRVDQWLANYPVKDRILFLDLIPFKETRDYVAFIARNYFWYTHLYSRDTRDTRDTRVSRDPQVGRKLTLGPGRLFELLSNHSTRKLY
jgi:soluble lytic murein transglycosylase